MSHFDEQKEELEALDSIFYGDFETISSEPPFQFQINVQTEDYEQDNEDSGLRCKLILTLPEKYPTVVPILEIDETENFQDGYEQELLTELEELMNEHLGEVMVFTIVSYVKDWLNNKHIAWSTERELQAQKKQQEEEEAELKRFEGTRVTVETFMKWRKIFEEETGIAKKREIAEKEGKKLTGRELFMRDKTLNESDLQFLDEGDAVKVDESLFQELDDLDLDDDDDPDYDPTNDSS